MSWKTKERGDVFPFSFKGSKSNSQDNEVVCTSPLALLIHLKRLQSSDRHMLSFGWCRRTLKQPWGSNVVCPGRQGDEVHVFCIWTVICSTPPEQGRLGQCSLLWEAAVTGGRKPSVSNTTAPAIKRGEKWLTGSFGLESSCLLHPEIRIWQVGRVVLYSGRRGGCSL